MIELKDVYKIYETGDTTVHALDGITLHIDDGEFVAIVGQSGSRKINMYEYYWMFRCTYIWSLYFRWYGCQYII